jgi:hypothetical protein
VTVGTRQSIERENEGRGERGEERRGARGRGCGSGRMGRWGDGASSESRCTRLLGCRKGRREGRRGVWGVWGASRCRAAFWGLLGFGSGLAGVRLGARSGPDGLVEDVEDVGDLGARCWSASRLVVSQKVGGGGAAAVERVSSGLGFALAGSSPRFPGPFSFPGRFAPARPG